VTSDNKYVLVANQGTADNPSTTVSIVDVTTFSVIATIETGKGAHGVVIDPSSRYAYITNIYENTVSVIDIEQKAVIATISSGAAPNGISFSTLPALAAPSPEIQLEIPEGGQMDMPGMTP
jgi:YVTN family beta-propeller protein